MQLKSILNRVARYKSFVYGKAQWLENAARPTIEVRIEPRANGRPVCSGCGRAGPGYDRLPERRFEFVPLWQIAVFFVYAMRRVDCPQCGVTVERVPWAEGKCTLRRCKTINVAFRSAKARPFAERKATTSATYSFAGPNSTAQSHGHLQRMRSLR